MTLEEFFQNNKKIALGFSGGVDSSYLLYAGIQYGADIHPYFVKGAFQPEFELEDARKIAEIVGIGDKLTVLEEDIMSSPVIVENTADRCYYCKKRTFELILSAAKNDGYTVVIDGTNASDDISQRLGYRALKELQVMSPLRMAGLTKEKIRKLSEEAGLFTWDKPSYACLATRIPTGMKITDELLNKAEQSEKILAEMGFRDFRVRVLPDAAKLQFTEPDIALAIEKRQDIINGLNVYFENIYLDMKSR